MSTIALTDPRLTSLLERLTLEEKVQLLTGRDFWTTWPIEKIGLRRILVSDGPSGVRGEVWDERSPSLNFPSATALSSAWDPEIARRYGAASAVEARRKGVDVVLGPTINLHRSPLGGRHFEAFSEDPMLTGALAAAYVDGVQSNGVGATPKHYIANDFETERFTANVQVADRALRELYLRAFEPAITESHAWLVMSSYNSINGATATENELLETPLNSEWGFDGVVVSDWTGVRSTNSARYSQDLAMPGPDGAWGSALVAAVRSGEIEEAAIDRKVLRILLLAARIGALEGFAESPLTVVEDGVAFARTAEAAGAVLVRNTGELPWAASTLSSIAVIGHNARDTRSQGGGSATVLPEHVVSPLEGITAALPGARVSYSLGAIVQEGVVEFPLAQMTNPATGEPGLRARFLDAQGSELFVEDRRAANLVWFGGDAPIAASSTLELTTTYLPLETAVHLVGFAAVGHVRIYADDTLILETDLVGDLEDLGASLLAPPSASAAVELQEGTPVALRAEFEIGSADNALMNALSCSFGLEFDASEPDALIDEAVAAAREADVALVVVGTNSRVESEGFDRTDLALPGAQDRLVAAVAAANPRTVVVVNSGSPVLMPWRNDVAAVLLGWFGGQQFGEAIADVLLGDVEPGGRLPTTWPAAIEDVPVINVTPDNGQIAYTEGIHIGYRAWLKAGVQPAFEFGHGLGYTTWELSCLEATSVVDEGGTVDVTVTVTNTGERAGKQVVQAYLERPSSSIDRPVRWLVGFAPVAVEPGTSAQVSLSVPARAFAHWADGWSYEPGEFTLRVGTSVLELPLSTTVELAG